MSDDKRPEPSPDVLKLVQIYEAKQREIDLDLARLFALVDLLRSRKDDQRP